MKFINKLPKYFFSIICIQVILMHILIISIALSQIQNRIGKKHLLNMENSILKDKNLHKNFFRDKNQHYFSDDSVQIVWQQQYASQLAPGRDEAADIAMDQIGNVYITGTVVKLPYGTDILTIKYDRNGQKIWELRFDGLAQGDDRAQKIGLDSDGNVYVFGTSIGVSENDDIVTIKYNPDGIKQWAVYYNGPTNGYEFAFDMSIDILGNVFVTGMCVDGSIISSIVLKYDSNGEEQWAVFYDQGQTYYWWIDLENDSSGNVYVTGTIGVPPYSDYLTIKYDAKGNQLWQATYDGTGNRSETAHALSLDDSGNVYITGISDGLDSGSDCVTIKYDSDGNLQWLNRYNGSGSADDYGIELAISKTHNIYLIARAPGGSGGNYATIRLNANGVELAIEKHSFEPQKISFDQDQNVYILGNNYQNYMVVKYDLQLNLNWIAYYNSPNDGDAYPTSFIVDASENIFVIGRSNDEITTVKFDSLAELVWASSYESEGTSYDRSRDIAIDINGNVYILGDSRGLDSQEDFVIIKYDSIGTLKWQSRYNGPGNDYDYSRAIAVDLLGNVYVTGESEGINTRRDITTIKYNSNGVQEWINRYNGAANLSDRPARIEVDRWGNVYVAGSAYHTEANIDPDGLNPDYTALKYSPEGQLKWIARYSSQGNYPDLIADLEVDDLGNVYVTGRTPSQTPYTSGPGYPANDFATIKYNSEGKQLWFAQYNSPANSTDIAHKLYVDKTGNVFVLGSCWNPKTFYDIVVIKYSPFGEEKWIAQYSSPDQVSDYSGDFTVNDRGDLFLVGRDYSLIKFDRDGNFEWVEQLDLGNSYDSYEQIFLDDFNNIYVSGDEGVIAKYNSSGQLLWLHQSSFDIVKMAMNTSGNLFTVGSDVGYHWSTILTTKLKLNSSGFILPQSFSLLQNFPNPACYATNIRYTIPKTGLVTLKVYNMLGQEVETLVNHTHQVGTYNISWGGERVPSGIYIYRLEGTGFSETKKLLLIK